MMQYKHIYWSDLFVDAAISTFVTTDGGSEYHVVLQIVDNYLDTEQQFYNINRAVERLSQDMPDAALVLQRYFVSDAVNQAKWIDRENTSKAVSIVQQPPVSGAKLVSWLYFVENAKIHMDFPSTIVMERNGYKHLYNMQLCNPLKKEYEETEYIFSTYIDALAQQKCTIKHNCVRTWIYVNGVDIHYADMVKARTDYFNKEGLTSETNYIASTGIEGRHVHPQALVLMDAYAIYGIKQEQMRYLYAPTHLNRTHEYNVTFERGTTIDFGDRRHIYISGTASINNRGEVVHIGDVEKQTKRAMENVITLLAEADATTSDVAQMIIYIRDTADYDSIKRYFDQHYSNIPKVIVWAPVCRPTWLIEVECIAITSRVNNCFPKF